MLSELIGNTVAVYVVDLFSCCSSCCAAFRNWQTAPFMEVEVAIRLLYMLGEALPASHGAHFSGDATKTSALQDMMRTVRCHCGASSVLLPTSLNMSSLNPQLVSCNVSSYQHTSVSLEFFETVVRYDKFFIVEPQHIPVVLVSFCVLEHVSCIGLSSLICSLTDGVLGPTGTAKQQPKGPQQGGLPLLPICQKFAVSSVFKCAFCRQLSLCFTGGVGVILLSSPVST